MFAAIPNYMDQYYAEHDDDDGGLQCLEILNQIISEFDAVIFIDLSLLKRFIRNFVVQSCHLKGRFRGLKRSNW